MHLAREAVAVSFTGGKDSVLALHLYAGYTHPLLSNVFKHPADAVDLANVSADIKLLVTFAPAAADGTIKPFRAHPLEVIRAQAEALGIPHLLLPVTACPTYLDGYRASIAELYNQHGVQTLVTGDILDVADGFMQRAVEGTGIKLATPLWQLPRASILQALFDLGIRCRISCINRDKFSTQPGLPAAEQHAVAAAGGSTSSVRLQPSAPPPLPQAAASAAAAECRAGRGQPPVLGAPPLDQAAAAAAGAAGAEARSGASDLGKQHAAQLSVPEEASTPASGPAAAPAVAAAATYPEDPRKGPHAGRVAPGSDAAAAAAAASQAGLDALRDILGAELTRSLVAGPLQAARKLYDVDLAGEGGEYHTLCFDGPLFGSSVCFDAEVATSSDDPYAWLSMSNVRLCGRHV